MGQARDATKPDDEVLARRARNGDVDAFSVLVTRYEGRLWRFLATWVRDRADREELVQEVFMGAFRGIGRFRGEAKFSTWFFQIAVNQARSQRRRAARRPRHVELPEEGALGELDGTASGARSGADGLVAPADPERAAAESQTRAAIWALVDRLPDDWQAAMRLRYGEELTHPEIAAVLGVPVGTVKARLYRSRRRLAEWLADEGIE